MTKPATKKSPTSSSGKSTDVRPQVATPKGTATSLQPVPFASCVSERRSLARAEARLDLVLERLAAAKESSDRQNPIDTAHAEALFDLVWDAQEDIAAVLRPGR